MKLSEFCDNISTSAGGGWWCWEPNSFYWSYIKWRKEKWQQMAKQEFDKLPMKMNWYFIAKTNRQCSEMLIMKTVYLNTGDHETVGWPIHCSSHFTWAMTLHSSPWNMGLLPSNNYLDLSRIISKYHHSEKYLSSALQETIVHQQHQVNLYKNQDLITLRLASDLCLVMILH